MRSHNICPPIGLRGANCHTNERATRQGMTVVSRNGGSWFYKYKELNSPNSHVSLEEESELQRRTQSGWDLDPSLARM